MVMSGGLFVFLGVAVGAVLGWFARNSRVAVVDAQASSLAAQLAEEKSRQEQLSTRVRELEENAAQLAASEATAAQLRHRLEGYLAEGHARDQQLEQRSALLDSSNSRLAAAEATVVQLQQQRQRLEEQLLEQTQRGKSLEQRVSAAEQAAAESRTQLTAEREAFENERAGLEKKFSDTFQKLAQSTLSTVSEQFLTVATQKLESERSATDGQLNTKVEEIKGVLTPVQSELTKFQQMVSALQERSAEGFGTLQSSLQQMAALQQHLRDAVTSTNEATGKLRDALNNPKSAGHWGEIALERIVEMGGMQEHCHYDTQVHMRSSDDTSERPDMIIHLTGDARIPVDAKASATKYLEACNAETEAERVALLKESAAHLRGRVRELQQRAYDKTEGYAGVTFMFVPNEAMLSSALAEDLLLLEEAAQSRIIICSPLLLLCYLKAFANGWSVQKQQDHAREIAELGAQLHDRFLKFFKKVGDVGTSLKTALNKYNAAVASGGHLLVPGRRLGALLGKNDKISSLKNVDEETRIFADVQPLNLVEDNDPPALGDFDEEEPEDTDALAS